MILLFLLLLFLKNIHCKIVSNKDECRNIDCSNTTIAPVCGIRQDGEGFRLKVFDNECLLLKNGCLLDDKEAYGIINMEYCENSFKTKLFEENLDDSEKKCSELECPELSDGNDKLCAMKEEGKGFRLRIFENKCHLWKYNCEYETDFKETDSYLCNETENGRKADKVNPKSNSENQNDVFKLPKNLIIIDNLMNFNNINESIDNFFAATHVFDLPMREVTEDIPGLNVVTRRMRIRNAGPVLVFKPLIEKPKVVHNSTLYMPLLSSCYHKCPSKCPPTYSPVCGVPGNIAREPTLTFQNHCFMDAAQCKMKFENKGPTAISSFYLESSFLFCLGEELNGMYRFLPLVRTLQHMGRLKKKGHFRYKLRNLRFFNNFLSKGNPNFMG